MPEVLKAVVFLHRLADKKDFTVKVHCMPAARADYLEQELNDRVEAGEIQTVQIGRIYTDMTVFTPYQDEVDAFLEKIDEVKLYPHGQFTGFDDVELNERP